MMFLYANIVKLEKENSKISSMDIQLHVAIKNA